MTAEELLRRLEKLKVNRASRQPALYQPITLLWAIGRSRRGEDRLLAWEDTERVLRGLLERHGMHGERGRPDYPIAALCHADLWELIGHAGSVPTAHGDATIRRWFDANRPTGGLPAPIYDLVRYSGDTRLAVLDTILRSFFQGLDYSRLLEEVGLFDDEIADDGVSTTNAIRPTSSKLTQYDRLCRIVESGEARTQSARTAQMTHDPLRSAAARRAVIVRSLGQCENPGCAGQPADLTDRGDPILEIDHVDGIAFGGRDHPIQMIALCPNCHAIKTRGSTRDELRQTLREEALARHTAWMPHVTS